MRRRRIRILASSDRALVAVAAAALLVAMPLPAAPPGRVAGALLAGRFGLLTRVDGSSPGSGRSRRRGARRGAARRALRGRRAVVVFGGRWVDLRGSPPASRRRDVVAVWNLVARVARQSRTRDDTGALAHPVGYANGLALLCVLGLAAPARASACGVARSPCRSPSTSCCRAARGALAALGLRQLSRMRSSRGRARQRQRLWRSPARGSRRFRSRGHERRALLARRGAGGATRIRCSGSGAGTFHELVAARARRCRFSTLEAHSLYLETLAELGPLGLALLLVALAAPLAAAVRLRRPELVAALVAYDVAAAFDFHWELAGVTAPVVLLGASAAAQASARRRRGAARRHRAGTRAADGCGAARVRRRRAPCRGGGRARPRRPRAGAAEARAALRSAPFSADGVGA